ncbi:hypothetical protein, partial [Pseudomonas savastanoi]
TAKELEFVVDPRLG